MSSGKRKKCLELEKLRKQALKLEKAKVPRVLQELNTHRAEYATRWSEGDARYFETNGHYQWMAGFVDSYSLILEVGTGDGRGTLELAKRGHKIISVDENPKCLEIAYDRLRAAGIETRLSIRESVEIDRSIPFYGINYDPPALQSAERVHLLSGDTLKDPSLIESLLKAGPFDAVVCWLIGTHHSRSKNVAVAQIGVDSSADYRLRVQNSIYRLADRILRSKGVLHIVDRHEGPTEDTLQLLIEDAGNSHRDQAKTTSLVVDNSNVAFKTYDQLVEGTGLRMVKTLGLSGRDPGETPLALCSTIACKP